MKVKYLKLLNIFALLALILAAIYINYNFNKLQNIVKGKAQEQGFVVREIHVNELKYINIAEVISNLDFKNGDDIFAINLEANQKRLVNNFWIDSVSLRKVFPDIIEIHIVEKKAEFVLYENEKYFIIDLEGNIIKNLVEEDIKRFADFIVLSGENAKKYTSNLLDFIKIDRNIYNYILEVMRITDQRWNIKFVNNMIVKLPQKDPKSAWNLFLSLNEKIRFFDIKVKSIDLRVEGRLFLELDLENSKNLKIIKEIG